MESVTIEEAQAKLPEFLRWSNGLREIEIVDHGKPVGRLVPPLPKGKPVRGRGKGKLTIHCDDDEHLKDFAEYLP